jgi:hypothetical protein
LDFTSDTTFNIHAVLKNGPRYNFAIDDPNEKKKITGNEMAPKTLQT